MTDKPVLIVGLVGITFIIFTNFGGKIKEAFGSSEVVNTQTNIPQTSTATENQNNSNLANSNISPVNTEQKQELIVNEDLIEIIKIVKPDFTGSDITNLIHSGGLDLCGYKGTNGKCYVSKYEAWVNGSVPNYSPHDPLATRP